MSQRFCRVCGRWHDVGQWPIECRPVAPQGMSDLLPVPQFISDTMDPTEHIDGRVYTSKSQFARVTKAHGCIEIGNDPARFRPRPAPKPDKAKNMEALKRAEYLVSNGIPVSAAT